MARGFRVFRVPVSLWLLEVEHVHWCNGKCSEDFIYGWGGEGVGGGVDLK